MRSPGRILAGGAGFAAHLLLLSYPPRFRREVGRELVRDLRRGIREHAASSGRRAAAGWAARQLVSLARNVGPAWREGTAQLVFEPPSRFERRRPRWLADLGVDLAYGFRQIRRKPGFAFVVLLILALGIGANTAIFSVVDALILRPLPFAHEGRLVSPEQFPLYLGERPTIPADVFAFRDELPAFDAFAAWTLPGGANLVGAGDPARIEVSEVTPGFFATLGVDLARGRGFTDPAEERVVVLSHRAWRDRYGSDPEIVGRTVRLNDVPLAVIGIAPPEFALPDAAEMWIPMSFGPNRVLRGSRLSTTVVRLAPGRTVDQGRAELALFAERRLAGSWMEEPASRIRTVRSILVGGNRASLLILLGATGLILLVACGNLANLFLTRAIARRQELSVRSSLGAGVGRLVRQLTTEALVVAGLGGILGIGLAYGMLHGIVSLAPSDFPRFADPALDVRVFGFALAISALTGLAFGVWPARVGTRFDLVEALKSGISRHGGPLGGRRHGALVVAQVGFTFILLVGGSLLLQSLMRLWAVDPGFEPEGALTVSISPTESDPAARTRLLQQILRRVRAIPGVDAAGAVNNLPLGKSIGFGSLVEIAGRGPDEQPDGFPTYLLATAGYFEAIGVPVTAGRTFQEGDSSGGDRVAIINRAFAEAHWPGRNPVGDRIRTPSDETWATVVGVVENVREWSLTDPGDPQMFFMAEQAGAFPARFVVRGEEPGALIPRVRDAIRSIEPTLPLYAVSTMSDVVADQLADQRFLTMLLASFGLVALLLAAAGVYGVLAYRVAGRRHEIGVRLTFGARRPEILRLILRHGLTLVLVGLAVGLAGAAAVTRVLRGLLFQVGEMNPAALGTSAALLMAVAGAACLIPALRAASVDPARVLHE